MVTFTTLVKICSTEYFCNTKVAWLGEIFYQAKIFTYTVHLFWYTCISALSKMIASFTLAPAATVTLGPMYTLGPSCIMERAKILCLILRRMIDYSLCT